MFVNVNRTKEPCFSKFVDWIPPTENRELLNMLTAISGSGITDNKTESHCSEACYV